ncbi:16S rRNA pseudouridine516 synthase [Geopseudomonas sagittaria]|uniref:Pseudouridine synthase n=1 Tax=Geopseudomonas sagittaria TaxID=1135990 RepID=A0A1I5XSS6_9GAMM|nr:pseudouridine synthase [Pseudomonas sagittaria]SFQ34797.1 16S rRNA pseudouridine516 synthase [Pseudomonas sagittaria]
MRLDRFLSKHPEFNRQDVRHLLLAGRVRVDGQVVGDGRRAVNDFNRIELDERLLQPGYPARYLMLHKPAGVVSATRDPQHRTVLDLLPESERADLHIAGRLDGNTTGLLLLTNDGQWSRRLTLPGSKLPKVYQVETAEPIGPEYVATFARGIYFAFEDLTTQPAHLELLGSCLARLTLTEGRYHQVKRMFGHFRNRVTALHRESIGPIRLDPALQPGQYRPLRSEEIACC